MPEIKWITAVYAVRFPPSGQPRSHISVPEAGRHALQQMANELVGTDDLLAAYLTVGSPRSFHPDIARGRIIGAAQLIAMPEGKVMEDYPCDKSPGDNHWRIGWPVRWIYLPPEDRCPELKDYVANLLPGETLRSYTEKFRERPHRLERAIRANLTTDFHYLQGD